MGVASLRLEVAGAHKVWLAVVFLASYLDKSLTRKSIQFLCPLYMESFIGYIYLLD